MKKGRKKTRKSQTGAVKKKFLNSVKVDKKKKEMKEIKENSYCVESISLIIFKQKKVCNSQDSVFTLSLTIYKILSNRFLIHHF